MSMSEKEIRNNARYEKLIGCLIALLISVLVYYEMDGKKRQEAQNAKTEAQFNALNASLIAMNKITQDQFKEMNSQIYARFDEFRATREMGKSTLKDIINKIITNHRVLEQSFKNHDH